MNVIEQMLAGQMEMSEFIHILKTDPGVQSALNELIPEEAKDNRTHDFWRVISYESVKKYHYDLLQVLDWICKYDGTLGDNLNIWGTVETVYMYHHPDFVCTRKYEDQYNLYLDVVKDCFDGPEVNALIEKIIQDALTLRWKKQQIEQAKREIKLQFHVDTTKRPRWIQGPEWPIGSQSPMKFISQNRHGEVVEYWFEDVDTHEKRKIEQYY